MAMQKVKKLFYFLFLLPAFFYTAPSFAGAITLPGDFGGVSHLNSVFCTNTVNCIAAGYYYNISNGRVPVLFSSTDGGSNWTSISLATFLPADFRDLGQLFAVTCVSSNCVAVGDYSNIDWVQLPLIVVSSDAGVTWSVPTTITLPTNFISNGQVYSITCISNNCITAGTYYNDQGDFLPLILNTSSFATTWSSASSVTLPSDFLELYAVKAVYCTTSNCILVGHYFSTLFPGEIQPLLLESVDNGVTWTSF